MIQNTGDGHITVGGVPVGLRVCLLGPGRGGDGVALAVVGLESGAVDEDTMRGKPLQEGRH
jgi:hypothetical protein